MARDVITMIWCDPCLEIDDIKVEAKETPRIILGNAKPRILALCKQHWADFYEPLEEFVTKFGVIEEKLELTTPRAKKAVAKTNTDSVSPGGGPGFVELPNGYTLPRGVAAEKADEYRVVCPVEGCKELQKNASTTSGHLRAKHETNLFETIGRDGVLYDLDGLPVPTPKPRAYKKTA